MKNAIFKISYYFYIGLIYNNYKKIKKPCQSPKILKQ